MSIQAKCGGCGKTYKVDDRFAGKKAKCKACGEVMVVPGLASGPKAPVKAVGATAQRAAPKATARKVEPAEGEFDFSGIDDIESSGTIDHSYQAAPMAVAAPKLDRSRGTPAPAHLRNGGTLKKPGGAAALPVPSFVESLKPGPVGFAFLGLIAVGLACFAHEKAAGAAAMGIGIIGILCCAISKFSTMSLASEEGFLVYLLYRFMPFYGIYFICTRWDQARQSALTWMKGAVLLVLAIMLLIRGGGMSHVLSWTTSMGGKTTAQKAPADPEDDEDHGALDGTASGTRKFMEYEGRKAAKKRQADLDNQSWQPFPTVTFPVRTKQPELGEWVEDNGVMGHYAWNLNEEYLGEPCRISLYLPVGPHAAHSLPCVVFAPGSYDPIAGSAMAEADLDEAVGFAESGFAVLIYETSGFSSISRPRERWGSVIEFMRSEGGAHIARSAMNLLEARAVMVDMNRVYAVGHESSAPLALNLAANDPRIHGVALFAPSTDIEKNLGEPLATVEKQVKIQGLREFVGRISPVNRIKDLHCPILVLGSEETASSDGVAFAAAMTKAGKPVVSEPLQAERSRDFLRSSMVPAMAKWLRSLPPAGAGPKAVPR